MPTTIVNPHKYKKFLYSTTPNKKRVRIQVEASNPIDAYIVQESDLENWREGGDYGGVSFNATKIIDAQVRIPREFERNWYLILENKREKPAAVHYELFDL